MNIFVTGASGWVGAEVTRQLIARGHQVTGIVRSDRSAAIVAAAGGRPVRGELTDLDVLAAEARAADGVIHCGFIHDFSNFAHSVEVDKRAIEVLGEAMAGSNRPLLVTAGTAGLAPGRAATEEDPASNVYHGPARVSEQVGLAQLDRGVAAGVVRLPPTVHGTGDHGFIASLVQIAREKGRSAYVGQGGNVWPAVHRDDAAAVFVRALETGRGGWRYHAVAEQGVPFRQIAAVIGEKLGVPVVSVSAEEAGAHFGWMQHFVQFDVPTDSALTRQRLNWTPTRPGLIEDLEQGHYFEP